MGIKFKWFRHRLTFDPLPTSSGSSSSSSSAKTTSSPSGLFRRSKSEAVIVTGYYRRSLDDEIAENNAPRNLPPIKSRAKNQQRPVTLPSAPSMPSLSETAVYAINPAKETPKRPKAEERLNDAPAPEQPPPIPPKRKEQQAKEEVGPMELVVAKEPPPRYTEEQGIKAPPPKEEELLVTPPSDSSKGTDESSPPSSLSPKQKDNQIVEPVAQKVEIQRESPPVELRKLLQEEDKRSPELDKQSRPHTLLPPAVLIEVATRKPEITIEAPPPPLPTSAPPLEDPKPWFEIEEEIVDQTLPTQPRTSHKKAAAPLPPVARISNPTDELPVLIKTPEPRLTPTNESKFFNGHSAAPDVIPSSPSGQKPSKIRAFFGLSSPVSSPEPPKPKSRRIRVPKQKSPKDSPKPLPRTISMTSADGNTQANNATPSSINEEIPLDILPQTADLPEPPVRKTKPKSSPKTLSFAETATVFTEEEEVSHFSSEEDNDDSWDLVAKHRANINQNINLVKAAARRPKTPLATGTEKRVDFVPVDRPKTMREMRKSQSIGAGVNLRNKDNLVESDTEV